MSLAIDTNVIAYVVSGAAETAQRAAQALESAATTAHVLVISPPVYAELLALPAWAKADLDAFVAETKIRVDWSIARETWIEAGLAFARYAHRRRRQKSGAPRRLLADFVIGAHALTAGGLLTADAAFYRTNFPDLAVVAITLGNS